MPRAQATSTDIPEVPIEIRNLTGIDWVEVWYVADKETDLTNYDGLANSAGLALRNTRPSGSIA